MSHYKVTLSIAEQADLITTEDRNKAIDFLKSRYEGLRIGMSLREALDKYRHLLAGEKIVREGFFVPFTAPHPLIIRFEEIIDPDVAERKAFEDKYQDLLERGAAGDGVAAAEYCRALLAGEVTYGLPFA